MEQKVKYSCEDIEELYLTPIVPLIWKLLVLHNMHVPFTHIASHKRTHV